MENFIVSARKYRPATFRSVVGQDHITSTLKNAISRNQLAHAYLFCGPRGVGKTTCARIFARSINCLSPVDNEACGECESCRSFSESRSFNIHELDAASNNSVDNIRSLTDQVRVPPQIGRYSVYIIDEVHMLSAAAFNAFLKTLEEPPAHAIFILATTEKHKIIPTILSRCQIFDFNRIRIEDSVGYLRYIAEQENITTDDESLHLIAAKADGGMRDALSMFDKAVSFCGSDLHFKDVAQTLNVLDYDTYFGATEMILQGDYRGLLLLLDQVIGKGFSGQLFMAGLATHLRDLMMCKDPATAKLMEVSGSVLDRYKAQAGIAPAGFLFESIALLTQADGALRSATNRRLVVEVALMKLCAAAEKKNGGGELTLDAENFEWDAPELPSAAPATAAPAASTPTPAAATPTPAQAPQAAPAPPTPAQAPEPAPTPQPQTAAPIPAPASPAPADPAANPAPAKPKSSMFGSSIASILSETRPIEEDVPQHGHVSEDPRAEEKIKAHTEKFLRCLTDERPRIAMAFRNMTVEGNVIRITVPSTELADEINRSRVEVLLLLAATAEVSGNIELDINIVDKIANIRPIKREDKLKYLTELNPLLDKLRKDLDLEDM